MNKYKYPLEIRKDRSFFVNRIHQRSLPFGMSSLERYSEGPLKMEFFSKDFDRLSPLQGLLAYEMFYDNAVFQKTLKKTKKRVKEGLIPRTVEKECFYTFVTNHTMFRLLWSFSYDIFDERTKEVAVDRSKNFGYIVCRCRCYPCKMKMKLGSEKNPLLFTYMIRWILKRCKKHIGKKQREKIRRPGVKK